MISHPEEHEYSQIEVPLMDKVVKKYHLSDSQQESDEKKYWQRQSAEHKLEVLESLRRDAFKLGIYPEEHECRRRLRNVFKVAKRS